MLSSSLEIVSQIGPREVFPISYFGAAASAWVLGSICGGDPFSLQPMMEYFETGDMQHTDFQRNIIVNL